MMPPAPTKKPFRIDSVLARPRAEVRRYPDAAMFELRERGHRSLFEQLVACILSIRTRDEVSVPTALRLFARARTPHDVAALAPGELRALISASSFADAKAG